MSLNGNYVGARRNLGGIYVEFMWNWWEIHVRNDHLKTWFFKCWCISEYILFWAYKTTSINYWNINLLILNYPDPERFSAYNTEDILYYPFWDGAKESYNILSSERKRIWRTGSYTVETLHKVKNMIILNQKHFGNCLCLIFLYVK